MSVTAMTIAQMNAATPRLNGDATLRNLRNNETVIIRLSSPQNYHHSDYMPKTRQDAERLLRWSGGNWSWNWIPCTLQWGNNVTACAIHTMPHSVVVASNSFNIFTSDLRRNSEGSHMCLHYINSMEVRFRSLQTSRDWWQRGNNAVQEAVRLANANTPQQPNPTPPAQAGTYIVQSGDTFTAIARRFNLTTDELWNLNGQIGDINRIDIGQIINVPTSTTIPPPIQTQPTTRTHIVTAGENLSRIAGMYSTTVNAIMSANPQIKNANVISIGQRIVIP